MAQSFTERLSTPSPGRTQQALAQPCIARRIDPAANIWVPADSGRTIHRKNFPEILAFLCLKICTSHQ
ncbi:hypothetical protein AC579_8788 [Pseudocercospora musae]|uniref:Uncharacterized protein n=1 Tax=Pseudocercospora musae TaxID=113226 RepID=A0A139IWG9_9PEZI|nr:hypothetical protein AC579_8788 [Pseudocercospora musae]